MKMTHFFVDRPTSPRSLDRAAIVGCLLSSPSGRAVFLKLRLHCRRSANYPGANARPSLRPSHRRLSQEINGVEDMLYMSSYSFK